MNKIIFTVIRTVLETFLIGLLIAGVYFNLKAMHKVETPRKDINTVVMEMIKNGEEAKVLEFYDKWVGNRSITYLLVSTSLLNNIPILLLSLLYQNIFLQYFRKHAGFAPWHR